MDMKFEDGRFTFSLVALLESMSLDEKIAAADSIACDEDIIKHVLDQIIVGWTENGSHGYRGLPELKPHYALEMVRRRIAEGASEVAKKEIDGLKKQLEMANERQLRLERENRDLYDKLSDKRDGDRR